VLGILFRFLIPVFGFRELLFGSRCSQTGQAPPPHGLSPLLHLLCLPLTSGRSGFLLCLVGETTSLLMAGLFGSGVAGWIGRHPKFRSDTCARYGLSVLRGFAGRAVTSRTLRRFRPG